MANLVELYSKPVKMVNIAGVDLAIKPNFNYVTIDQSGHVWAYEDKPRSHNDNDGLYWDAYTGDSEDIALLSDVTKEEYTKIYEI